MPYLGNIPASEFRTIDYQDFTGVTGSPVKRGFTLTSPVSNANDLEVFVNNVRQEPGVAYTVAGTTLTMTGDVETTDDFYIVYQGKAVASVVPTDGSVSTTKIADDAVTSAKIADDAITLAKAADSLYRSGTWTPTLTDDSSNSASFTTTLNQYVRIGNVVHLFLTLNDINTTGMTTGDKVNLGGLPFNHIAGNSFSTLVHTQSITLNNISGFTVRFLDASKTARFEELRTGQNDANMLVSDLTSGSADIGFNAFYLTADA